MHRTSRTRRDSRLRVAQGESQTAAVRNTTDQYVDANQLISAWSELDDNLRGFGVKLRPLIDDESITDVLINGTDCFWVDGTEGLKQTSLNFSTEKEVRELAVRLAAKCGRRLDDASPVVDGVLPEGVRLHAVIPPLSPKHTLISLRCPSRYPLAFTDLIKSGAIHQKIAPVIRSIIDKRLNGFICGATGAGKTTFLSALIDLIPHNQRILCIEEVAELRPLHPHFVSLQERQANIQNAGGIGMPELVRAAMRMRPDRLVLGECRGAEVREVLTAINTGHEGSWATIHSNNSATVPARLAALGALANLDTQSINAQIIAGIDVVLQISKYLSLQGPKRWLSEISCVTNVNGRPELKMAIKINYDGSINTGPSWAHLTKKLDISSNLLANSSIQPLGEELHV